MKDRILTSYLNNFVDQFGLGQLEEPEAFEHLASYCVVSKHNPEDFDTDHVVIGGRGDLGLDGVAILVNEHLVLTTREVNRLKNNLHRLDVQFIFIQAKTSPSFSGADIGTMISGVRQFFASSEPDSNAEVRALHQLKEHIFDNSIDMDRSPICRLYYVTSGKWADDPTLLARIRQGERDLEATNLFSSVEFTPLDADGLKQLYRELNQKITREIKFEKHTIIPAISGVKEAYIGILPCLEYLKLICDDQGDLNRRLFYDNVRDFQGYNTVNQEIATTVRDTSQNDRFALLNNGVTIVARDSNQVGETFRLRDYQIVNGCQTSHILHLNKEKLTDNVFLPIKLIVTGDAEVTNQIIKGTNRQTEVKLEALEAVVPFQKELEEFYLAEGQKRAQPIFYERRSKQYEYLNVRKNKIITLATQVQSFVSMFLNEPHSTHRYYGELLDSYRNRLFRESHSPIPYYVAGLALSTVEQQFASGLISRELKPFKYQLLMVFRLLNSYAQLPPLNSKDIDSYCQQLLDLLDDEAAYKAAFQQAGDLVRSAKRKASPSPEPLARTRAFTNTLVTQAFEQVNINVGSAQVTRLSGSVKQFDDRLGYGFITGDDGTDYFVHYTGISGDGYRLLAGHERVEFAPFSTERGLKAVDVEVV